MVAAITRSRLDEGLPPPNVDLHPDRPDQRGTMTPTGTLVLLNPEPTFEAIESAGGRVTKHAEAHVLAGFFFVSGEIERVTSYEAGFARAPHGARRAHCAGSLDPRRAIPRGARARPPNLAELDVAKRNQVSRRKPPMADDTETCPTSSGGFGGHQLW